MRQANYKIASLEDPTKDIKKKFLLDQQDADAPNTEEISAEASLNKPARTKKQLKKDKAYQDKKDGEITGGAYDIATNAPLKEVVEGASEEDSWMSKNGGAVVSGALGVADMAVTVASQKGAMNKQERKANTMNLAMKGAATGATIGSVIPGVGTLIGAAAGGIIGAGTGLIQGMGDQKELDMASKLERVTNMDSIKDEREKAQRLADGKDAIEKKKNILKSQMGTLGSNYTQTKIT